MTTSTSPETADGGSPGLATSQVQDVPNWKDNNARLKVQYLQAQADLDAAISAGDDTGAAQMRLELDRIGREFYELNKGLAVSSARKFSAGGANVDDYLAAAACGLWEAFTRWDPTQGTTFGTFSRQFINGRIHRTVRQVEFAHLSQNEFNLRKQVRTTQTALSSRLGRTPSAQEIATATGIPLDKVQRTLSGGNASLDSPVGDGAATLMDVVAGRMDGAALSLDGLEDVLDDLSNLELWILTARSDIYGGDAQDIKDVAATLGIGREIVRRAATRGALVLAASQFAKRFSHNPTDEELAEFTGKDLAHVRKYRKASMRDLQDRYGRIIAAIAKARTRDQVAHATQRLDRFGEEFLDATEPLARDISGRHHTEPNVPIGVDEAYWVLFTAFLTWDEDQHGAFPGWARQVARSMHGRAVSNPIADEEAVDKTTTWSWIRHRTTKTTTV